MSRLKNIQIKGFRSIKEITLELRPLNILIGANGAGKSNLITFFKLVNELMGGRLQQHIGATGRATANLYFGPKITPQLEAELVFEVGNGTDTYLMRLFHGAGDSLIFAEETLSFHETGFPKPKTVSLGPGGHEETRIGDEAEKQEPIAKALRHLLNRCRVYHFHDTSPTSRVRQYCYVDDKRWLMPDAANLAAVLYELKSYKGNSLSSDCGDYSTGGAIFRRVQPGAGLIQKILFSIGGIASPILFLDPINSQTVHYVLSA